MGFHSTEDASISSSRQGLPGGGSTVYVLPLVGCVPKLITEILLHTFHGWAPNNKELVYVAMRNGKTF